MPHKGRDSDIRHKREARRSVPVRNINAETSFGDLSEVDKQRMFTIYVVTESREDFIKGVRKFSSLSGFSDSELKEFWEVFGEFDVSYDDLAEVLS
jgi:hypothetical protein